MSCQPNLSMRVAVASDAANRSVDTACASGVVVFVFSARDLYMLLVEICRNIWRWRAFLAIVEQTAVALED